MRSGKLYRAALVGTASALALGSQVFAQAPPAQASIDEVVVTGSRIVRNGADAPVPMTVVSAEQLAATTPTNIPDGLNKLPAFNSQSSPNNATTGANGSGFNTPGNYLNLRNLGAIRTLILQDGRRVPGTFYDTTVDTDMLPQLLISRVDVVTGGASAVYGSDAVSGVVNFITDRNFNGFKGVVQGGISKYGDTASRRVGVANGFNVGERGHFEWSAEYYNRDAIESKADRPYGSIGSAVIGAGTTANPYELIFNARQSNAAYGGLVVGGPFNGQQFAADGSLVAFNPGVATRTPNAAIGGDGGTASKGNLIPTRKTGQVFGRFDYDVTETIHASIEARYARATSYNTNQIYTNSNTAYPLYIYSGNAFLTPAQQAALSASGTTNFRLDRFDQDLFTKLALDSAVDAGAVTFALNGTLFGDFSWDAYYTHGETKTRLTTINNVNSANFFAATDAVRDPATNSVVCRATITAPGAFRGCSPLNLFGEGRASAAALDFIFEDTGWTARNNLDDFGANITGTAFEGWAGPVKVAVGGEYRRADLKVATTVPSVTFNPQYLRLGAAGDSVSYPGSNLAYFKEAQTSANGSEDIFEGNIEFDAPILRDLPFAKLVSLNGGYRHTKYETEGNETFKSEFKANTWKIGGEWQVYDDLRIRASRSRDIRAPTLWDLYRQQLTTSSGITDNLTRVAGQANTISGGNPNLLPEEADNTIVGMVYQPSFLDGFSVSVDWYRIEIDNAIGSVNGLNQTIQDICLASPGGSSPYCALVVRPISYNSTAPGNYPIQIYNVSQNIARTYVEGYDFELSYRANLADHGLAGVLNTRFLWTHQPIQKTLSLPGAITTNAADTSALPVDKINLSFNYRLDKLALNLTQRWSSSFGQNANPTLVFNIPRVDAYTQTDASVAYDFEVDDLKLTTFLNVNNLFNSRGGIFQVNGYTGSLGMNYPQAPGADLIGRYYTAGVRFRF